MERNSDVRPLIFVTNDDGVRSPGLLAAVAALYPLGELLVAAPLHQHSGAGRSFPRSSTGRIHTTRLQWDEKALDVFGVEATPAQTVDYALLELAPRLPDLAVVGINYGENVGAGITASGTVGAALEVAMVGIPALAVSLETPAEHYFTHSEQIDFRAAAHFVRFFARQLLSPNVQLPSDVDVLKIDVPQDATPGTPWRITRVSRQPYFEGLRPERGEPTEPSPLRYRIRIDRSTLEPDSDIHALVYDRVVSVAPISVDLSSRTHREELARLLTSSEDASPQVGPDIA